MSTAPQALFVSPSSLLGGAERILLDEATALAGPVVIACPEGPLTDAAQAAGIEVATLVQRRMELRASMRDRLAMPLRVAAQSREVRRIVTRLQPRCVIGWSMRGLLSAAGAMRGLESRPPLIFAHNDLLPSPLVGRAVRAAAGRADLIVALSQAIADDLDPDRSLSRVEVVRPGVDLARFAPSGPPPRDPPTALLLGAIVGWKRPDFALEVVARAASELPDLRLVVAGAPIGDAGRALLAQLQRRAGEPDLVGRVQLVGAVEDVPATLAAATCLLHCADREPYGMAVVEALASGRPVVAPAAAGPTEIVDERSGVLYPAGDAGAAATALVQAVDQAVALGHGARERAEAEFDRLAARDRFRRLIDQIAPPA